MGARNGAEVTIAEGKGSGGRLGQKDGEIGFVVGTRLHLSALALGALPNISRRVLLKKLERGRVVVFLERLRVVVDECGFGLGEVLGPLAMGGFPVDGKFLAAGDAGYVLVQPASRLAIGIGEDGGHGRADGAVGAGGGRGRVERVLAICVHLAQDARAVALSNVRLHGFCDACGAARRGAVPGYLETNGSRCWRCCREVDRGYCMKLMNSDQILINAL